MSVWIATCTSISSATDKQQSIAAGGAPILIQLQPHRPRFNLLTQGLRQTGVTLTEKNQDSSGMPRRLRACDGYATARRAGRCISTRRRASAAAQHGGDARHQRLFDLRADEMNMAVDAAAVTIIPSPAMTSVPGANHDRHTGLNIRVARPADRSYSAIFQPDIRLDDAGHRINDQCIGDHRINSFCRNAGSAPCHHGSLCHRQTSLLHRGS